MNHKSSHALSIIVAFAYLLMMPDVASAHGTELLIIGLAVLFPGVYLSIAAIFLTQALCNKLLIDRVTPTTRKIITAFSVFVVAIGMVTLLTTVLLKII